MKLATVTIGKIVNGKVVHELTVNAIDYATDLGRSKYRGYSIISEQSGDKPEEMVDGSPYGVDGLISAEEALHNEQRSSHVSQETKNAIERNEKMKSELDSVVHDKHEEEGIDEKPVSNEGFSVTEDKQNQKPLPRSPAVKKSAVKKRVVKKASPKKSN